MIFKKSYFIYILIVNYILFIINYKSILLLNIDYLVLIYFVSSFISFNIGLYFAIYKFKFELNTKKQISLIGKICFFSFIIIYSALLIGLKSGYLFNYLESNFLFNKIIFT